jgi:putative transposase
MFISYHPTQNISKIAQWLNGISSRVLLPEFPHLKKQFWGRHFWARGYPAVSSGNITGEMIQHHIEEQEGQPIADDSRFQIGPS